MGNRIGTYRKEGENFVLYDFNDKKVENPEDLMKNPPTQKDLKYFYNNITPIGAYTYEVYTPSVRYYPARCFPPANFYRPKPLYIVRPSARIKF